MHRSIYGVPPPSGNPPASGSGDARNSSNLAVQPASNAPKISLKKAAVKIVGAASAPPVPRPVAASPAPVTPKETDGVQVKVEPVSPVLSRAPSYFDDKSETKSEVEIALEKRFARLNATASPSPSISSQRDDADNWPLSGPIRSFFSLDKPAAPVAKKTEPMTPPATIVKDEVAPKTEPLPPSKIEETKPRPSLYKKASDGYLEREYLKNAREFVAELPTKQNTDVDIIKIVTTKLHQPFVNPATSPLTPEQVATLRSRYVNVVVKYITDVLKKETPVSASMVEQTLKDTDGDFLQLMVRLVENKHLALDSLEEVAGLCKAIVNVMPQEKTVKTSVNPAKPASGDPIDKMTSWPSQEARENPAKYRTCILKGVANFKTINQLQAVVWGGRLESISMPEPGANFATVRFLRPEDCQKYFDATQNGIDVPGKTPLVVFVEQAAGPNSANDVIKNCVEGDATRCVRALDADDDWSDVMLLNLARGQGQSKREVDCIKRGKTGRDRFYLEFRFANIYHALNFNRQLKDDIDWEHCTIGYAPDPCETARGVHMEDIEVKPGILA